MFDNIINYTDFLVKIITCIISIALMIRFAFYCFEKRSDNISLMNNVFKMIIWAIILPIVCALNEWKFPEKTFIYGLFLIVIILTITLIIAIINKIDIARSLNASDLELLKNGKIDKDTYENIQFNKTEKFILGCMMVLVIGFFILKLLRRV